MPEIPEHIRNKMDRRMDYHAEEAAGRRILRGLGVPGVAGSRVTKAMKYIGMIDKESTEWQAAIHLLRYFFAENRSYKAGITEYYAANFDDIDALIKEACSIWESDTRMDIAVFGRIGGDIKVAHNYRSDTVVPSLVGSDEFMLRRAGNSWYVVQSVSSYVNRGLHIDETEPVITQILKEAEERGFTR